MAVEEVVDILEADDDLRCFTGGVGGRIDDVGDGKRKSGGGVIKAIPIRLFVFGRLGEFELIVVHPECST